jgi:hypothetical protein
LTTIWCPKFWLEGKLGSEVGWLQVRGRATATVALPSAAAFTFQDCAFRKQEHQAALLVYCRSTQRYT